MSKPVIKVTADLDGMVTEAIDCIARTTDEIYQRGGVLEELATDPPNPPQCLAKPTPPRLVLIKAATLQRRLSQLIDFQKFDARKKEWVSCLPPPAVVNAILSSPDYQSIPPIMGLATCPQLRPDGSIACEGGYDDATGLLLTFADYWPSPMSNEKAVALLDDILFDFPFAAPMYKSAWIAALLSLLCRPAYAGPAPLFLFDANMPGCGKGLLIAILIALLDGSDCLMSAAPRNGDETRKSITSNLIAGAPYICWDNIRETFGGPEVENIITASSWSDRILGVSQQVRIPVCWVLLATGNNAMLLFDMFRRVCRSRLETKMESPDKRGGFRHDKLLAYVLQNRKTLVMAALSIAANYIVAGRPDMKLTPWRSFDGWSDLIRQSMAYAGLPDCDTRDANKSECAEEDNYHSLLVDAWRELGKATTVREAVYAAEINQAPTLKMLLDELPTNTQQEHYAQQALGKLLRKYRNKPLAGFKFVKSDHQIPKWTLQQV